MEVTRKVYAALAGKAQRVIAAGHSAIVDAVFSAPGESAALAAIGGAHVRGLFLVAMEILVFLLLIGMLVLFVQLADAKTRIGLLETQLARPAAPEAPPAAVAPEEPAVPLEDGVRRTIAWYRTWSSR